MHIEDDIFQVMAEENNVLYVCHRGGVCTVAGEVLCTVRLSYVPLTSIRIHTWTIYMYFVNLGAPICVSRSAHVVRVTTTTVCEVLTTVSNSGRTG